MPSIDGERPTFQFGSFELDRGSGELRKHGIRIKLQDQPLQVLSLLLERAGQVITREELRKRLWPDQTYVDYDNAINSAVRKLRDALNDSAENPRFVETLARRGYRFIAPVKGSAIVESEPSPAVTTPGPAPSTRRLAWVAMGFAVLVASAVGVRYAWIREKSTAIETAAPPVPLTSYPGFQRFPTFSPEGDRIAFAWDQPGKRPSSIYVKLIGSGEPVQLTSGGGGDVAPAWSPDGRTIAFLRTLGAQESALMLVPAVGGPLRELTRLQVDVTPQIWHWGWMTPTPYIAWSPDSKWLLSLHQRGPEQPARIVRISAETGDRGELLPSFHAESNKLRNLSMYSDAGGLAISHDGRRLAFTHTTQAPSGGLYVVGLTGQMLPNGQPERLNFEGSQIQGVAWDPDGRSLIVSSNRRGRPELWRVPMARSNEATRLNAGGDDPSDIALSATGQHLVYSHYSTDWDIWRVGLTGSPPQPAAPFLTSTRSESRPAYSPDGTRIAFESARSGSEEIWTSDADGSRTVQLTSFGNAWAGSPKWSPDGAQIAFDCNAAGVWHVYVIPSGGGKPVRLTTSTAAEIRPSWSHDGKSIYFCSSRSGDTQVWKKSATGGEEVQITKNGGCEAAESGDGDDLYYLKDETALWEVKTRGGEESEVSTLGYGAQFTLVKNGALFFDSLQATTLRFLDFRTHTARTVTKLPGPLASGLAVSPDGQWLLFAKSEAAGSQLMLVERFR